MSFLPSFLSFFLSFCFFFFFWGGGGGGGGEGDAGDVGEGEIRRRILKSVVVNSGPARAGLINRKKKIRPMQILFSSILIKKEKEIQKNTEL